MARIAVGVEYDGSAFAGWQFQRHARSVQGELERALSRVADHPVALVAAGLNVPEDGKTKPTFGELAGEIFWLNRSTKGDLWLNAKASKAKKARSKKSEDDDAEE